MTTVDKDTLKIFDKLDKLNPEAKFLSDSALSTVTEWHDTGCMVLNSIISGSMFGGVPKGRITGFAGPSQAGKTYITNKILAKAHWICPDSGQFVRKGLVKVEDIKRD